MHPEFHAALLSHGIATALTTVCRALSHSALEVAEIQLKGFLWALADNLGVFPRHRWITESLRAGLLPAIFSCGAGRHIERTGKILVRLLHDILPASTVYHSVLSQL